MNLFEIRHLTEKAMLLILWLHVPIVVVTAMVTGSAHLTTGTAIAAVGALAATGLRFASPGSETLRIMIGAVLMVQISTFLFIMSGHPWQIDMHMYFFAGLGMLAGFACWKTIIVAAAVVAVHHLVLNFALPWAVFPDGGDFFRVVLHAVIVILETAALIFLTHQLVSLIEKSEAATEEARAAASQVEEANARRRQAEDEAGQQRAEQNKQTATLFESQIGDVAHSLESNVNSLKEAASGMRNQAGQTGDMSKTVAGIAGESRQNIQSVAAAVEELSASISEIANQSARANSVTRRAVDQARGTEGQIQTLADTASKINEVVELINAIAEQTNLLALNATIEAARAGESGKGFAVVASEVKNLAGQTANATSEIVTQIGNVQSSVTDTAAAIREFVQMIDQIAESEATISSAVEEQKAATAEIANIIQQTARSSDEVSEQAQTMQEVSGSSANASLEVEAMLSELDEQRKTLSARVEEFVTSLRG